MPALPLLLSDSCELTTEVLGPVCALAELIGPMNARECVFCTGRMAFFSET